jgi:hypothetical protein
MSRSESVVAAKLATVVSSTLQVAFASSHPSSWRWLTAGFLPGGPVTSLHAWLVNGSRSNLVSHSSSKIVRVIFIFPFHFIYQ